MRYAKARQREARRELAYRIYVTDALKIHFGLNARYADSLKDKDEVETRTAEEIIGGIRAKLQKFGGEDNGN